MTWIMFDKNLLNVETGFFFNIEQMKDQSCVQFRDHRGDEQAILAESFETLEQAQQRFEELKQLLIRRPRLLINTEGTFKEILNGEEV